jgi:hypothetical protein
MPDYDEYGGDYESITGIYISRTIGFLLEFYIKEENRFIHWCSDNIIEILNAIKSYKYRKENETINNEERRKYVLKCYKEEIKIEIKFMELLENNCDNQNLEKYIMKNKIVMYW